MMTNLNVLEMGKQRKVSRNAPGDLRQNMGRVSNPCYHIYFLKRLTEFKINYLKMFFIDICFY